MSFAFFIVIPFAFRFLMDNYTTDELSAMLTINEYLSFILKILIAFGVVFQLPVISFVLTRLGLITPTFLWRKIRYAIVGIFIIAAFLTPPDVATQIMMALPLILLYFLSIAISYMAGSKKDD
jgi:sec-independent protein translocase protein TatC